MRHALDPNPDVAEEKQSLLLLTWGPAIWLAYFLLSYAAGALWCGADVGRDQGMLPARLAIGGAGVAAMLGILVTGRRGWVRFTHGEGERSRDDDTPEDRHRFLGFATVLLAGLSAVATFYTALTAIFVHNCR
jgi:hypothetical protein